MISTSNSTVGARATISVSLSSSLLTGDTLKFLLNDSSATAAITSSGAGSNVNFTFNTTGGYWQYVAVGALSNIAFQFLHTNPSYLTSNESFPSLSIGNGV